MADQPAHEDETAPGSQPAPTAPSRDADGARESPAIEHLIREHHADVYRYAYRLSGAHADAEDLVQQTFLVAYQKLYQLREPDRVRSWLFSVLRSCFLKSKRRTIPTNASTLDLDMDSVSDDFDPNVVEIDGEHLQQALNQLPDDARLILAMFYFEEASYKEIADQLEIKIGTVMSRLSRAKQRLRQLLFDPATGVITAEQSPEQQLREKQHREKQRPEETVGWGGEPRSP